MDLTGKLISEKAVDIVGGAQVVPMTIYNSLARGPYMVKVLNQIKKAVFTDKLLVEGD
jgi:hypothetical protein